MALPTPATSLLRRPRVRSSGRAQPSLWTLGLRALTRHRLLALSQFIAIALAVAVPLSLRLVENGAAQAGYQSLLASGSGLVIIEEPRIGSPERFAEFRQRTAQLVDSQVAGDLKVVTSYTRAGNFRINTLNGKAWPGDDLTAAYYPDLQPHVALVNGVWPNGNELLNPIPTTLSQAGAAQAGLAVGDIACVGTHTTPTDKSWCVRLVGTWRPIKPSDSYWQSGPSNTDITFATSDYFQFLAAANRTADDVSFRAGSIFQPDPARFKVTGAPAMVQGLRQLRGQVAIQQGGTFLTSLDQTIQTFLDRTRVNQFPSQLVAASLVLVVVYALALLSQSYLDTQLQQSLLWRTRGGRRERLTGFFLLQMGILLVPAVLLAVTLSLASSWLVLSKETGTLAPITPEFTSQAISLFVGIGLVLIVESALVFRFSHRSVLEIRRALIQPSSKAWWRWRNIDLGLALLAVPLLAEVQLRSQVAVRSASSGPDLVGLALPVVALAVLGLAALRLLPLFARVCELAPRNLAARFSWLRMSRQPTEHAGVALLLAITMALGVFASVYSATERQSIVDRAAYKVGADVVVRYDDRASAEAISNDLAKLEHVASATTVLRKTVQVPNSSVSITALGVEPRSFPATAWTRGGLSTQALGPALERLTNRQSKGIPVLMSPVTMSRLGIRNGVDVYMLFGSRVFLATVVGQLDFVPTLYPGTDDFMVMALDQARSVTDNAAPNELWLNVTGDHSALVGTLLRNPNVSFVQDRSSEEAIALSDPLFLELQANLAIGFVAALTLGALVFTVHFLLAARRRSSEHAILEANGLEPGVVRTGIAIEQGVVVLFAAAVGCALALTLIIWLLPSLQLGSGPSDLVPPTVLQADWLSLGISAVVTLVVVGALAWAIRRSGTSVDTIEELRRLG